MRYLLVTVCLIGMCCSALAQHGLRFQNSYFLTGQPLFGLGYSYTHSAKLSYGLNIEFGRYLHQQHDLVNAAQTAYSITGAALVPEVRWFFAKPNEERRIPQGIFISGFSHIRHMDEYLGSLSSGSAERRKGFSIGAGAALGYRTSGKELPVFFEFVAGYGRAHARWDQDLASTDLRSRASSYDGATTIYRLELAVGYIFK